MQAPAERRIRLRRPRRAGRGRRAHQAPSFIEAHVVGISFACRPCFDRRSIDIGARFGGRRIEA
ncbi:hypothetical protein, partial [Burkholderia thailandensis]|uniref:hypothetical protein n=1 Tax=Burkholderia thailandensis TaxID=57975 RepID=UPI0021CA0122